MPGALSLSSSFRSLLAALLAPDLRFLFETIGSLAPLGIGLAGLLFWNLVPELVHVPALHLLVPFFYLVVNFEQKVAKVPNNYAYGYGQKPSWNTGKH